jgi:BirA family biotin operon repressor/biotin-[acetyl-CoA-carboxylase] ligase
VPFDQQQLESLVGANQDLPLQLSFHRFETLSSTNHKLWELIDQGAEPGTVVIATQQTAGRGQWGRHWQSPEGGLYLSIAVAPNLPVANSAMLTFASAWGIATALRDHGIPVLLKWPNDLVLMGHKLGGILTQTRVHQGIITKAVIGVGINWANSVPETGINLKSFFKAQAIQPIKSLEMLLPITIKGILSGYQNCSPEKLDVLLSSYHKLLINQEQSILVDGHLGIVVGVTPTGDLRVRLPSEKSTSEICLKLGTISLGYGK